MVSGTPRAGRHLNTTPKTPRSKAFDAVPTTPQFNTPSKTPRKQRHNQPLQTPGSYRKKKPLTFGMDGSGVDMANNETLADQNQSTPTHPLMSPRDHGNAIKINPQVVKDNQKMMKEKGCEIM